MTAVEPALGPRSRMWEQAERDLIPLGATVEITLRCNLRCVHCYNFDRSGSPPPDVAGNELTPPEILDVIDQLADAGTLYLSLTGGEALLHPHIYDFVRHARDRRFVVKVKTNGLLLTGDRVQRLVDAGAHGVDVSLYGARSSTHDAFTRRLGAFDQTVAGIRSALAAGLDVKLNMNIVRSNVDEVAAMADLAEGLGVSYSFDPFITARYDGTTSSLDERVTADDLDRLYRGPLAHLVPTEHVPGSGDPRCGCARTNCAVTATGDVYPCIAAPLTAGNVRDQRFAEIWRDSPRFREIRGLELDDFSACAPCADRAFCSRTSGVTFSNTGDFTGPEDLTCANAAVLHQIFDEQVGRQP